MRKNYKYLFLLLFFCSLSCTNSGQVGGEKNTATSQKLVITAARGVIERLIGNRAQTVNLELLPATAADSLETYEIEAQNGKLTVRGNSAVALTFGFYQYLKKGTNSMVSWSGQT